MGITKGMIETAPFQETPNLFALCMVCVLIGAACSTLLATAYGFPISATHGIIGGLIAAGLAAKGTECVGWGKLGMVAISWVVAPLGGALVAIAIYLLIQLTVFKSRTPVRRARIMQPVFLWMCIAVNVLFIFIKGPKDFRIRPIWKAILFSSAIGLAVVLLVYPIIELLRRRKKMAGLSSSSATRNGVSDEPCGKPESDVVRPGSDSDSDKDPSHIEQGRHTASQDEGMPNEKRRTFRSVGERGLEALGLSEDITADDSCKPKRQFSFRTYESVPEPDVPETHNDDVKKTESYFVMLLCISAFSVCVAHGGNDVGNALGPMAAILEVYNTGNVAKTPDIPLWATLYGALGFAVGILTMGRFTIKTVGTKITVLSPSKAFATQIGGAVAVLSASVLGMPVSTSHCLVGAVFGIGLIQKLTNTGALNMKVLTRIFVVWIVTIPLAMLFVIIVFYPFRHFF